MGCATVFWLVWAAWTYVDDSIVQTELLPRMRSYEKVTRMAVEMTHSMMMSADEQNKWHLDIIITCL